MSIIVEGAFVELTKTLMAIKQFAYNTKNFKYLYFKKNNKLFSIYKYFLERINLLLFIIDSIIFQET